MKKILLVALLILSTCGLYLGQQTLPLGQFSWIIPLIDYILVFSLILEAIVGFINFPNKRLFLKKNIFSFAFLILYLFFFILSKTLSAQIPGSAFRGYYFLIIVRYILLALKVFGRMRKLTEFLNSIFSKPAQTVVLSFLIVIFVGTLLLMMPFMNVSGSIGVIDAFFTVTSAVCVTGLVVLDTAKDFTLPGQIVILVLIQIGGLGIMLLSYFMIFSFRRSVSIKDRTLLSYMLNESDMKSIKNSVKRIILITFSIEAAGMLLLFPVFLKTGLSLGESIFYSIFHAISAFCNAGFALFSNSLMNFQGNYALNFIIAGLIIAGGISFSVLTDLWSTAIGIFKKRKTNMSINTKVVIRVTGLLLLISTLVFYKLEHHSLLYTMKLGEQYLAAFFQAVTLRTAGFNTVAFENLSSGTLLFMIGIMFIGGASGSTAGGIKVNTLGVVWAYIQSFRKGRNEVLLFNHQLSKDQILHAFTVIIFGMISIFIMSLILLVTEDIPPIKLIFEGVSAFATVGLSTGITASLSTIGKICIIILMFFGRIGPLTLLTASSKTEKTSNISYPDATLLIG